MIRTQIQLPAALHTQLKRIARQRECSLAEVVRRATERYVQSALPERHETTDWKLPTLPGSGGMKSDPADHRGEAEALHRHVQ